MPNNGIRIYKENGKGIDIRWDVYKILGISPRSNGFDIGYACGNTHGKINPMSKRKPYAFGNVTGYTDAEAAANNWGMTPVAMRLPNAPLWGQWQPPKGGLSQPFRLGDFNGYNHKAIAPVHVDDLYFVDNNGDRRDYPTLARKNAHYYGYPYLCVDFRIDPGDFVMSDFRPTWSTESNYFKTFKPTLIFAAWEGVETRENAVWIAQTEDYVGDLSGSYQLRISTANPEMYTYIVGGDISLGDEEGNRQEIDGTEQWIAAMCLAPAVRIVSDEGEIIYNGKPTGTDFIGNLFSLRFSPDQKEENLVMHGSQWKEPVTVTPNKTETTLFEVQTYNPEVIFFEAYRSEGYLFIYFGNATATYSNYSSLSEVNFEVYVNIYDTSGSYIRSEVMSLGRFPVTSDGSGRGHVDLSIEDNAIRVSAPWLEELPSGQYIIDTYLYFYGGEDVGFIRYEADQSYDNVDDSVYDRLCETKGGLNLPSPCVLYNYQRTRRTIRI